MGIAKIAEQAMRRGYLSSSQELELSRLCNQGTELSTEDYLALDELMGAMLIDQVVTVRRKQFTNIMEELVTAMAIDQTIQIEAEQGITLELGDIVAYALNRLPPLYATTQEGADYQRLRGQSEILSLIEQQVTAAIDRYLVQPDHGAERVALAQSTLKDVVGQLKGYLGTYASAFPLNPSPAAADWMDEFAATSSLPEVLELQLEAVR